MVHQLAGVTGGEIGIVESELDERYKVAVEANKANLTAIHNALPNLQPKYNIMYVNSTATGIVTWTLAVDELNTELQMIGGHFSDLVPGSTYFLFNLNIPLNTAVTSATISVKHTPLGQPEYDFFVKAQQYSTGSNTVSLSFVIRMNASDALRIVTDAATLSGGAKGYSSIVKLG